MPPFPPTLRLLVAGAAAISGITLSWLLARNLRLGRREYLSAPRGNGGRGLLYAFGRGMVDKESVTLHKLSSIGGLIYHGAVFIAFFWIFARIIFPAAPIPVAILRPVFLAGAVAGSTLLLKRGLKPHLRRLSCPDDFFANVLVDLFLLAAFLESLAPEFGPVLLVLTAFLLLYVPLGKIRHCVFFFVTRVFFGLHLGRRGALPGTSPEVPS